ncbi:hypothetical protein R5R35_012295 [Gryllus longicercus]|uniref:Phenylalanyl tRNA synthetase beta chain core domain-containing protein n=1 Tax=Gryllus longicercus TaxID=2509291 RepID=A0AAN9VPY7_9ORTH
MLILNVSRSYKEEVSGYWLRDAADTAYFPRRCAEVICYGKVIGKIGILHPDVIEKFELNYPVSAFEIDLEIFL